MGDVITSLPSTDEVKKMSLLELAELVLKMYKEDTEITPEAFSQMSEFLVIACIKLAKFVEGHCW